MNIYHEFLFSMYHNFAIMRFIMRFFFRGLVIFFSQVSFPFLLLIKMYGETSDSSTARTKKLPSKEGISNKRKNAPGDSDCMCNYY